MEEYTYVISNSHCIQANILHFRQWYILDIAYIYYIDFLPDPRGMLLKNL